MELNPLSQDVGRKFTSNDSAEKKRELTFSSRIYAITRVDTADLKCELDMRVWIRWNKLSTNDTWDPDVNVTFNVFNGLTEPIVTDVAPAKPWRDDSTSSQMVKNWRLRLTIAVPMNLRDFPADVQNIVVKIRVPRVNEQGIASVAAAQCELEKVLGIEDN